MRPFSLILLLCSVTLAPACSSNRAAGGRMDTGQTVTVVVQNDAARRITIAFSWNRDEPFPLGPVAPGAEETFEMTWQDLPLRMVLDVGLLQPTYTNTLTVSPDDTIRLQVSGDLRVTARVESN